MAKTSKSTKTETYAVLWLHDHGKSNEQIQDELGLDLNKIEKIVSGVVKSKTENSKIRTVSNPASMMIKESASGKQSIAVMTRAASEKSDSIRPKVKPQQNDKEHIHKIT
jgi:hypothetical protein